MREVLPAGSETTNVLSVGTALHRECVAVKLLTAPRWTGRVFQAILDWPERMDLWIEWERLLTNLADEGREKRAADYFETNQEAMVRGSRVLWPGYKPLQTLMMKRAELGPSAFDTEYQGNPKSSVGSEWPAEYFERPGLYFDEWPAKLVAKCSSLDPSKGRTDKAGDYQAHVWGGLDANGVVWVDAEFKREPVGEMVGRSIQRSRELDKIGGGARAAALVVEINIFGELLREEFERQIREGGAGPVTVVPIENYEPKAVRIRKADGLLSRSQVRVRNTLGGRELVAQWRDFPTGAHDDGPDAAAMFLEKLRGLLTSKAPSTGTWEQSTIGFDITKRRF